MENRLRTLTGRVGICLALASLTLSVPQALQGQASGAFPASQTHARKERPLADRLPQKPSIPPALSIPVEPLGFSAPGAIYMGQRNCMVSLDFLDENHLLFTFRVPGLMHREASSEWTEERQIRAVVLALPSGTVAAEALWTVHDRVRYLWMLKDGHFLLRDRDGLSQGDAALNLSEKFVFRLSSDQVELRGAGYSVLPLRLVHLPEEHLVQALDALVLGYLVGFFPVAETIVHGLFRLFCLGQRLLKLGIALVGRLRRPLMQLRPGTLTG